MGRELSGLQMEKKPNGVVSHDRVHVAPRISMDDFEAKKDYDEVKECMEENSIGDQTVPGVKSVRLDDGNEKSESRGSVDAKKTGSPVSKSPGSVNGRAKCTVPQPFSLATEKRASCTHAAAAETTYVLSPSATRTHIQPNSPLTSRKLHQSHSDSKKHTDEEDSWSVTSSTAASVRTNKSKVTVGHAPTFKSYARAEKRKEFYTKLEEKHQALEAERSQFEARTREEQDEAIKQLRKGLVIKANPVPSFYYDGPPPKIELKKLPLTQPKSPKLNKTNRRKSCSDAVNTAVKEEKERASVRPHRHSLGTGGNKESKGPANRRTSMDSNGGLRIRDRFKQENGTAKTAAQKIAVQS